MGWWWHWIPDVHPRQLHVVLGRSKMPSAISSATASWPSAPSWEALVAPSAWVSRSRPGALGSANKNGRFKINEIDMYIYVYYIHIYMHILKHVGELKILTVTPVGWFGWSLWENPQLDSWHIHTFGCFWDEKLLPSGKRLQFAT